MKSFVAFALIACLAVAPIRAQEEPEVEADEPLDLNAHLLVHKGFNAENNLIVKDSEFTVTYTLINVGNAPAVNVKLTDEWPAETFTVVEGQETYEFASINAGDRESVNVTVIALTQGAFHPGRATIEYSYNDGEEDVSQVARSTTFGETRILTSDEYLKETASYAAEWITFSLMAAAPIVVPFLSYRSAIAAGKKKSA